MRKLVVLLLLLLFTIVVQGSVISWFTAGSARFDLLFVVVIMLSLALGPVQGMFLALVAGLLQDATYGHPLGITSMSMVILAYLTGLLEPKVFKENIVIPALIVFIASLLEQMLSAVFITLVETNSVEIPLGLAGPLTNMLLSMVVYFPLHRLYKWLRRDTTRRL